MPEEGAASQPPVNAEASVQDKPTEASNKEKPKDVSPPSQDGSSQSKNGGGSQPTAGVPATGGATKPPGNKDAAAGEPATQPAAKNDAAKGNTAVQAVVAEPVIAEPVKGAPAAQPAAKKDAARGDPAQAAATKEKNKEKRKLMAWTPEEHERFLFALEKLRTEDTEALGKNGELTCGLGPGIAEVIAMAVGTRTAAQVRSHAQKHFTRQRKAAQKDFMKSF